MDPWADLLRLAAGQYHAVARAQALELGIADTVFTRRVRREQWGNPHRRVYVSPAARTTFFTRVSAALLAVGGHAAATAETGLYLHGVVDRPPNDVTLVIPHARRAPDLQGVRIIRSRTLLHSDRTSVRRLACATPERCILDSADDIRIGQLRVRLIDARQRRVVDPGAVAERARVAPVGVPGRQRLIAAADDVNATGADSALSDAVHRRLVEAGLSPDARPVAVGVPGGRLLHPDITFSDAAVCIECDSLAHHGSQRSIDIDHRKDQQYAMARWRCLRIGWRRFDHDWYGFAAVVQRSLVEWPRMRDALERRHARM